MFDFTYDAIDLVEWFYVVSYSFRFQSQNRYTQLGFIK